MEGGHLSPDGFQIPADGYDPPHKTDPGKTAVCLCGPCKKHSLERGREAAFFQTDIRQRQGQRPSCHHSDASDRQTGPDVRGSEKGVRPDRQTDRRRFLSPLCVRRREGHHGLRRGKLPVLRAHRQGFGVEKRLCRKRRRDEKEKSEGRRGSAPGPEGRGQKDRSESHGQKRKPPNRRPPIPTPVCFRRWKTPDGNWRTRR